MIQVKIFRAEFKEENRELFQKLVQDWCKVNREGIMSSYEEVYEGEILVAFEYDDDEIVSECAFRLMSPKGRNSVHSNSLGVSYDVRD